MTDERKRTSETRTADASGSTARIPPYISFQTLLTFFAELKANGLPPQIDGSVLRKFSGGVQSQLKMAIRALGLVDGAKPTTALEVIVDAYETPHFEGLLLEILKSTYPYVFDLDLMTATPTMFADAFKVTGAKEDVSRKCRTFFLHAAKRAGVPLGQRILTGTTTRAAPAAGLRRKPKAKTSSEGVASETLEVKKVDERISDKALEYKLIDLMREDGVGDDERSAIWTLVQYLTLKAKNKAADDKPAA